MERVDKDRGQPREAGTRQIGHDARGFEQPAALLRSPAAPPAKPSEASRAAAARSKSGSGGGTFDFAKSQAKVANGRLHLG